MESASQTQTDLPGSTVSAAAQPLDPLLQQAYADLEVMRTKAKLISVLDKQDEEQQRQAARSDVLARW